MKGSKQAILIVSFGTSHRDTLEKTISTIERAGIEAFPDFEVRRAFTSGMVMNILKKRDGVHVDNVDEALEKLAQEGFERVFIQPTHIINGEEYEKLVFGALKFYKEFEQLETGAPLLSSTEDYRKTARAVAEGFRADEMGRGALVLMGHGTTHHSNAAYPALDYHFKALGHKNIFVGTVEGYPELDSVIKQVKGYFIQRWGEYRGKKVRLAPFMIVAGDHAKNDMAGDEPCSWKNVLEKEGFEVEVVLKGLGEIEAIREIYLEHLGECIHGQVCD